VAGVGQLAVQRLAPVDHTIEGPHPQSRQLLALQKVIDEGQRAQRQRGRDDGNQQQVGRAEHALRGEGQAGRTVEEDGVVVALQRLQQLAEAALRPLLVAEGQVHVAVGEVGRQHVQPGEGAGHDGAGQGVLAAQQRLAAALHLGVDAQAVGGRALGVEVPQQRRPPAPGAEVGQVDSGGRLADAAFDVVEGDDFHDPPLISRAEG